jgi:hypothetical protein
MSGLPNIREKIKKNDFVLIKHGWDEPGGGILARGRVSMAIVLDTKERTSYIIYVAGPGSEVMHKPFWIDNKSLISFGT